MGVNLKPLTEPHELTWNDLRHSSVAIDAYNTLHQFLSIIRQRDGTPLKDAQGRVTSHLTGLFYRTANLVERDIRPVYVFDGEPHKLKKDTLNDRHARREQAKLDWQAAKQRGDLEEAKKKAQQTSTLTWDRVEEAQQLLDALGIPYIEAPGEGEAQASYMCRQDDVDYAGSQDFDCLLFGAPQLLRNLTISGRRKLPGKQKWVQISPEKIKLKELLDANDVTREQLVDIAILMGTDFNDGIKGIGPKTGLKLIKKHGAIESIEQDIDDIPHLDDIRSIFLKPAVTDDYMLTWRPVDEDATRRYLCGEHHFSQQRVDSTLEKFSGFAESLDQKNLFDF